MPDTRDKTNFRGPFSLHLLNLMRAVRRFKQTVAVRVYVESGEGTIYFDKGKLVHAESDGLSGEEAFMAVVLMRDGAYEKISDLCADVVSIERDIKTLLAEAKDQGSEEKRYMLTLVEEIETEEDKKSEAPGLIGGSAGGEGEESHEGKEGEEGGAGIEEPEEGDTKETRGEKDGKSGASQTTEVWQPSHVEGAGRGFQEELWMTDWGAKTSGFIAARIVREDGVSIMRALDTREELSPQVTKNVIDAAKQFAGDLEELLMESRTRLYSLSLLADGYYLVLALDRAKADLGTLEERLVPLIKALKESLEEA